MKSKAWKKGKRTVIAHLAHGFADADRWDLEFWQNQGAEMRLSALVALRRDILKIKGSFKNVNWE